MNQRTHFTIGIFLAIVGVAVLGADRMIASADSSTGYGQSITLYTITAIGILIVAALWLFISSAREKKE
jgi:hypothetical protein